MFARKIDYTIARNQKAINSSIANQTEEIEEQRHSLSKC